jgi:phosphoenolpyruvate-protein phosphotransferase
MARLILLSPLAGWCLPVEEIPDPVFAQRMVGDGLGIDPTNEVLHAPCDGHVFPIAGASHALSLRTGDGGEVLLHVGIDTVKLDGEGFQMLVGEGEAVRAGQPLLRFDLDLVARRAPSVVTPVLLPAGGRILARAAPHRLEVGDFLMEVEFDGATQAPVADAGGEALRRKFRVPWVHGLHARPAAQLVATLRAFDAQVRVRARSGEVDARSTTGLMALGARHGDEIELIARGPQAAQALEAALAFLGDPDDIAVPTPAPAQRHLSGRVASPGLALGPVYLLRHAEVKFAETAGQPALETLRLEQAQSALHEYLLSIGGRGEATVAGIARAHAELVVDAGLAEEARRHIAQGASAEAGWQRATDEVVRKLLALDDARMRERVADLRDVANSLIRQLTGQPMQVFGDVPEDAIVVAEELLPSQLFALIDGGRVAGVAMAAGGATSHVALMASARGLPMLVGLGGGVLALPAGRMVLLDAERGRFDGEPSIEEQASFATLRAENAQRAAEDIAQAAGPGHTRDGVHVAVLANLGAAREVGEALALGAEGCGLLRTEFLFLDRGDAPSEDEQYEHYRRILDALAPRPLTIRTMDTGGDKPLGYLPLPEEENPALGLRGLRTSLAYPQLLRTQLRAILRLRSPQARILLPMVTDLGDMRAARSLLRECAEELHVAQLPLLGAMIETPASALLATQLLREADFLSIGTNDLSQYTLAIDRGHAQLSSRLDALHPAVLRLIGSVAAAGDARGREVAVCGGLASDPEAVALLVGLGIRELSAVPRAIPAQKRILRGLDAGSCRELARRALELEDAGAVRALVASWPGATQPMEVKP